MNHADVQVLRYQKKSKQRKEIKSEESDKILTMLHHIKFLQEEGSLNAARDTAAWILAKILLRASRADDLAQSAHNKTNIIEFCKWNVANFFCYNEGLIPKLRGFFPAEKWVECRERRILRILAQELVTCTWRMADNVGLNFSFLAPYIIQVFWKKCIMYSWLSTGQF